MNDRSIRTVKDVSALTCEILIFNLYVIIILHHRHFYTDRLKFIENRKRKIIF